MAEVLDSTPDRFLVTRSVALLLVLLDAGLRISEALSFKLDQLDESGVVRVMGKGARERWVRLSGEVLQGYRQGAVSSYIHYLGHLPSQATRL